MKAIITGGAKGIGKACAEVFAREGHDIAILDIDPIAEKVATRLDGLFVQCDVSQEDQVAAAIQQIVSDWGRLDVLVNNAGIQRYGTVTESTAEEWDLVMAVNLKSAFLCAKHVIPVMQQNGSGVVINVASVQAFVSQNNVAAYTTAKTAMLGLTRSIAVDYAPEIRCMAVCPGTIDTPMVRDSFDLSPDPEAVYQECINMHPLKKIGQPIDVAEIVYFLSTDKAQFFTGQAVRVDGGLGITIAGSQRD